MDTTYSILRNPAGRNLCGPGAYAGYGNILMHSGVTPDKLGGGAWAQAARRRMRSKYTYRSFP